MSATTAQWKDKQHWSANQLNWSCQSISFGGRTFVTFFSTRRCDLSAHGMGPLETGVEAADGAPW